MWDACADLNDGDDPVTVAPRHARNNHTDSLDSLTRRVTTLESLLANARADLRHARIATELATEQHQFALDTIAELEDQIDANADIVAAITTGDITAAWRTRHPRGPVPARWIDSVHATRESGINAWMTAAHAHHAALTAAPAS